MNELINILMLHFMAFACAMIGFIYSDVLTEPDMIFHSWFKFLERKIGKYLWLFNPVINCFKCVSGQLAFWSFIIVFSSYYFIDSSWTWHHITYMSTKALFIHAYYISLTIYISWLISKKYRN